MKEIVSLLVPTIDSGGAEKQAVLLATHLSLRTKVNLIVLYGEHTEYKVNSDQLENSSVVVHRLVGSMASKMLAIGRILKASGTDILFCYLTMPDFIGSIWGKILGISVYNGIRNSRLPKYKLWIDRFSHNYLATGSIYNCYSGARYFSHSGFKENKNVIIPNCFPDISEPIVRENSVLKTIITVGRFDPQKDYKTLIDSVSRLDRNDFHLCIVGYGVLENQIRTWVKEYGIEDKADIFIKPDNVSELEKNADIYLSTSLFEGTSNSIMEALNWSLPVVATNVGDNDHLVIDGENGFLHPAGDVLGLAGSLCRLLDSADLRNKMGLKSNQNLRENYSMEVFEKRYIDLIEHRI